MRAPIKEKSSAMGNKKYSYYVISKMEAYFLMFGKVYSSIHRASSSGKIIV